jgi:hypothetical protein
MQIISARITAAIRLSAIVLLPAVTGCYVYRPAVENGLPPGEQVRITLTDLGTANLAAQVGPSMEALSGRLVRRSPETYVVAVSSTRRRDGIDVGWKGEHVSVPQDLVARFEQRRFSRSRTLFVSLATAVVALGVREAFWGPGGAFGGAPPGGGPTPR